MSSISFSQVKEEEENRDEVVENFTEQTVEPRSFSSDEESDIEEEVRSVIYLLNKVYRIFCYWPAGQNFTDDRVNLTNWPVLVYIMYRIITTGTNEGG